MQHFKRFMSLALTLLLVLSCIPATVFATDADTSVAVNTTTGVKYDSLAAALAACGANETVALLQDASETGVSVYGDRTLDLNGYALTAEYVSCFGSLIDSSDDNSGVLKVTQTNFMIRNDNAQLPVHNGDGYRFVEMEKINISLITPYKIGFQPKFENSAVELLKQGIDVTGMTVQVQVKWKQDTGYRTQNFVYNDDLLLQYLNSYNASKNIYGKMFTLTLNNAEGFEELSFTAQIVSETGVSVSATVSQSGTDEENTGNDVTTDANNQVVNQVVIDNGNATAVIPVGTQLNSGTNKVTLSATEMDNTTSNVTLGANEQMQSMNVHVEGVSVENTVPILVTLDNLAPEFLNQGNLKLYHVENGETVEMTRVYALADVDEHNEYYYDIATGTITVAMATFSEIAVVSDTEKAWNGDRDYSWYDAAKTNLVIANADQLAAFGAIVGGMAPEIAQDSFAGKTVTLIADINLADNEEDNDANKIFYPIGYNSSDGLYEKTGVAITSGFYTFEGTFNGNGHTIANFYQNTWEMKGDNNYYTPEEQYYRDGMGLFGKVYGGTVKNLTIKNFSSDGEFTTTGCIAAYADFGATFENIAIVECNPRVYNIGNGGIVGCVGWYTKDVTETPVTFKNITVDNSNKISALWGSWDVACGGILGQYYPTSGQTSAGSPKNAGVRFENCHVAAQIDVYNDVCANYQYYAYRYAGMLIGSVRENVTIDGHVYPKMDGITASGCTVHFGDWNDYYYCELVANSLASYTHDHQFSRLVQVEAVDVENMTVTSLKGVTTAIPTSGRYNYVVVNGEHATENATCYHFVDGAVWNHEDAGYEASIDEDGDGSPDLKEDKWHIYLEFKNLVTGYGWGVTSRGFENLEGVENLDITHSDDEFSVEKFEPVIEENKEFMNGQTVTIGDLFGAIENAGIAIRDNNVQVFVSPADDESTVSGIYNANIEDWTKGTLTFDGLGAATITITDYHYCTATTLKVNVGVATWVEDCEDMTVGKFPADGWEKTYGNWEVSDDLGGLSLKATTTGDQNYCLSPKVSIEGMKYLYAQYDVNSTVDTMMIVRIFNEKGSQLKQVTSKTIKTNGQWMSDFLLIDVAAVLAEKPDAAYARFFVYTNTKNQNGVAYFDNFVIGEHKKTTTDTNFTFDNVDKVEMLVDGWSYKNGNFTGAAMPFDIVADADRNSSVLKITTDGYTTGAFYSPYISVTPGQTITISADIKANGNVYLDGCYYDADMNFVSYISNKISATSGFGTWNAHSRTMTVPEGVAYMNLMPYITGNIGNVYFDNIVVASKFLGKDVVENLDYDFSVNETPEDLWNDGFTSGSNETAGVLSFATAPNGQNGMMLGAGTTKPVGVYTPVVKITDNEILTLKAEYYSTSKDYLQFYTYCYDASGNSLNANGTYHTFNRVNPKYGEVCTVSINVPVPESAAYVFALIYKVGEGETYFFNVDLEEMVHNCEEHKETVSGYAPGCTEDGLTEGVKCAVCGKILVAQETISALGHTEETIPAQAATCTETGLTAGIKCSVCDTILQEQGIIEALGHAEQTLPAKEATCTETGLTEGKKCSVCGEILQEQEIVEALGHTAETIPAQAATCTETGLTEGSKCSVCDVILTAQEETPALGHDWNKALGTCNRCGTKTAVWTEDFEDMTAGEQPSDGWGSFTGTWVISEDMSNGGTKSLMTTREGSHCYCYSPMVSIEGMKYLYAQYDVNAEAGTKIFIRFFNANGTQRSQTSGTQLKSTNGAWKTTSLLIDLDTVLASYPDVAYAKFFVYANEGTGTVYFDNFVMRGMATDTKGYFTFDDAMSKTELLGSGWSSYDNKYASTTNMSVEVIQDVDRKSGVLKLVNNTSDLGVLYTPYIPVTTGQTITISADIKTSSTVYLDGAYYDANRNFVSYIGGSNKIQANGNGAWTAYSKTFTIPEGVSYLSLMPYIVANAGEVRFDNIIVGIKSAFGDVFNIPVVDSLHHDFSVNTSADDVWTDGFVRNTALDYAHIMDNMYIGVAASTATTRVGIVFQEARIDSNGDGTLDTSDTSKAIGFNTPAVKVAGMETLTFSMDYAKRGGGLQVYTFFLDAAGNNIPNASGKTYTTFTNIQNNSNYNWKALTYTTGELTVPDNAEYFYAVIQKTDGGLCGILSVDVDIVG